MITTKLYEGLACQDAAKLALKHRLFVPGWYLNMALRAAAEDGTNQISLVFKENVPIAIAMDEGYGQVMAFCKLSERRQGYGSKAVQALTPNLERVYADEGVYGSADFWSKNQISVRTRRRRKSTATATA